MTTLPGTTERGRGRGRRGLTAALTALALLLVFGYAARASQAAATLSVARPGAMLANLRSEAATRLDTLSDPVVGTAIAGAPLDQRIVNVAMAREARRNGDARIAAWLAVLARLGWRDTLTMQNLLYAAAIAGDLPRVLDLGDALLRRRQLADQMIAALSTLETDPALRGLLVTRLAGNPSWRGAYLTTTAQLTDQKRLIGRYDMLRSLRRRGASLDQDEVIPNIVALDHAGLPRYGFSLWTSLRPGITRPLDDTSFDLAGRSYEARRILVPYQWQMMAGEGFSADASRDGARTVLSIKWSGRGVPLFAQQRTSAMPGGYALDVSVPLAQKADLSAFAFRLACDGAIVPFRAPEGDPTRLVTAGAVPCAYPVLQIAGDLQNAATAHQVTIERIAIRPLATPARR